jgi:hypothetical protein
MMFQCLLPIGGFDLIGSRLSVKSEDLVRINGRRRVTHELIIGW